MKEASVRLKNSWKMLDGVFRSLFIISDSAQNQILSFQAGGTREALNYTQIKQLKIPLPSLATQHSIVAEIEAEQSLVSAKKEIVKRFEAKIKDTLDKVWSTSIAVSV